MHRIAQDDPARPRFLEPVIPRDLETIVLKAIDKEPDRRYGSGADMADDLRRFLTDRPIQARRFGSAERLWRWCRRNPSLSVLTAAVILLAAALGAGMSIMHFVRVERDRAVVNLTRALEAEKAARHSQQRAERTEREVKIRAHLTQAVAYRNSGQPGRRYKCLEELRQAVLLDPSDELRAELRDEAIAAMAVVDLRAVKGPDITGSLVAFDPLNQRYAFLDEHGKVHVRRVGDLYDMSVLPPSIAGYMFSPNGQYLGAYTSDSGTTQIWDVESGKPVFAQPLQSLGAPSFSPDERAVAVSLLEGSVAVHELPSGRELGRVHTGMVPSSIAFHPDGQQVAMGLSRLRTVRIWDWQRGSIVAELPDIEGTIHHLAWDAEGRRLALALALGRAEIWDVATRERLASLEGHGQDVVQVAFNPAGLIETWSWDGHTRVWDAHTMRQLIAWPQGVLLSHSRDGRVLGLGFSSQNNQPQIIEIITGSEYRTLSSSTGAREATYRDGPASVYGDLLAVPMGDGVRIWELSSGNELALLPTENAGGTFFSRDGTELITSGLDGIIRWPIERDSTAHTVRFGPPHNVPLPIHAAHNILSLDGRTVGVCGDPPHKGFVVDLPTETVASTLEPHQSVNHVAVSGDGQWATSYGWHSNTVKVWEARTGRLVKEFEVGARAIAQFSRDNTQLIISRYADFSFYEVGFWRLIRVLPREYCPYPGQVAFSPDGSVMALELSSAVISLADTATGRTVAKLTDPHRDRPRWMEFTPDGRRLVVVASYAKAIHVWELGVIGEQLAAMDLDCDRWPASTPSALSACESVSIAVDLGEHSARIESQRNERQAQTHYDLAFAHAQSKRFAQAISEYNRAIELSPDNSSYHNNLAWLLATCDDPTYREESLAVEHAQRAVELLPNRAEAWNTLGVVYYRAGRWRAAIDALVKAEDLNPNVDFAYNAFFLAMAHWRLSESETAGDWFDRAVAWMEKNRPHDEELRSFRAEAEALIKH
jgi:WD40 repeat protein